MPDGSDAVRQARELIAATHRARFLEMCADQCGLLATYYTDDGRIEIRLHADHTWSWADGTA